MTIKPILFAGPMVRALLEGRKTQTRRVIKPQPVITAIGCWQWHEKYKGFCGASGTYWQDFPEAAAFHSRIKAGDQLYVREAWRTWKDFDDKPPRDLANNTPIFYETDRDNCDRHGKFRQSMHMPRWASRITLEITEVRVERLQDINGNDAIAEGIGRIECYGPHCPQSCNKNGCFGAIEGFEKLHDSINANPKPVYVKDESGKKIIDHFISYQWGGESRVEEYRGRLHHITANPWVTAYSFNIRKQNVDEVIF